MERTFRQDASRKPTAEGAAELVRELHEAGAQGLYLPPDSFLGTLAEGIIIPAARRLNLPPPLPMLSYAERITTESTTQ